MTWAVYEEVVREVTGRPEAHLAAVEMLTLDRDGFDGVRFTVADAPLVTRGPRKGKPNWRKRTDERVRLLGRTELAERVEAWSVRTGNCSTCGGSAVNFVSWSAANGTVTRPCTKCDGTGRALDLLTDEATQ